MFKRPKPGENEEDILRMQEEFLREKDETQNLEPAAKVVNLRQKDATPSKRSNSGESTRPPSKYAQGKGLKKHSEKRPRIESMVGDILEKNTKGPSTSKDDEDDKVYYPRIIPSLLGNIIEKNVESLTNVCFTPMPSLGFPTVIKNDKDIKTGRKSIFSQHIAKLNQEKAQLSMQTDSCSNTQTEASIPQSLNIPTKSFIITSSDAESIHKENIEKLTTMSEIEILDEQQKLLLNLDPKLVAFLKSKRKDGQYISEQSNIEPQNKITKDIEEKMDISDTDDSLWENDVLSHPHINRWLHFDSLEKDKLAWMKGVKENEIKNLEQPYEARFNFKGYLMPYTVDYTEETKTLFHHGEEPHRPGYSLTELIELTRSSVTQQRVLALNTLAGILEYYMAGTYKDIISIPLSKIFFVIRFALDENKVIILEPALKAMRNLLVNRVDEASLDALLGFEGIQQPSLENDKSEIDETESKESELKDFHLAEIDLITAAVRTDIIQRIYYILNFVKPSFTCVQYSLQILIRLARDSLNTAQKLIEAEHLIHTVINNFIPVTTINFPFRPEIVYNGKPISSALKFIRILSLQSKEISEILVNKHEILKPISEYINSGVCGTYGLKIQIEAFCLFTSLLNYNIGIDNAMSLLPLIITVLHKHVHGTDIFVNSSITSATHAAVVLQLLNRLLLSNLVLDENSKLQLYSVIRDGVEKWLFQISTSDAFTCAHLRLLCSALDCCTTILKHNGNVPKTIVNILKQLSTSRGFDVMINMLIPSSNLLSDIDKTQLHSDSNLMNLGTTLIDASQRILPVLNVSSPIPFLVSIFKLLEVVNQPDVTNIFIFMLKDYLLKLKVKTASLCENWFTRMEVDFIFSVIKLSVNAVDVTESQKDILYAVTNKLCYLLRLDKKLELNFLFNNVVFNKKWFTVERLMNLMSVSETNMSTTYLFVEEIKKCYSSVIKLDYTDVGSNVVLRQWQEPILPRDWIYIPILNLYSKSQDQILTPKIFGEHAKKVEQLQFEEKKFIISCSLEWIIFNEQCFPDLLNDISITDRFCRIMCIFLCDNSLFLDKKINILLRHCIQILFKKEKKQRFNFDRSLVGLHNFQDFYTQFLEQFQSVSYGDFNFATCVLLPLAQQHNKKWRKLLWSEYAGCLRALDCPEEYLCYDINEFLYPGETDESLLRSYVHALSGNLLRQNTIAYRIAAHHAQCFKNRTKS